jgi:hypothetical protein
MGASGLLFRQVSPVAARQLAQVKLSIVARGNVDGGIIPLPQRLTKFFVADIVIAGRFQFTDIQPQFACLVPVVAEPVVSRRIVNDPRLVGKARLEMPPDQWQNVIPGCDQSQVPIITGSPEPNKSFHTVRLAAYPHAELFDLNVRCEMRFGPPGITARDRIPHKSINHRFHAGAAGEIGVKQLSAPVYPQVLFQTFPHTLGLGGVGRNLNPALKKTPLVAA